MRTITTRHVSWIGQARGPAARFVSGSIEALRRDPIEQILFVFFVAGLAWVPFWYGSNDWIAWGINAIIFPGVAGTYEILLLLCRRRHPFAAAHLPVPCGLFVVTVAWAGFQSIAWNHLSLANPIWSMTEATLQQHVRVGISVNRDLTVVALMRLITAASVFWTTLQLCRDTKRGMRLLEMMGVIFTLYAAYGIVAMKFGQVAWLSYIRSSANRLNSTFIDPDSFATYAGMGFIVMAGLTLDHYSRTIRQAAGNWRLQIAFVLESTRGRGAALMAGSFIIFVALLLTGSRGGLIATAFGLIALATIARLRSELSRVPVALLSAALVSIVATAVVFGHAVGMKFEDIGISDTGRLSIYLLTLRSIWAKPILGYGYGTFVDVFPMYRDRSINTYGIWSQAHNTYLEIFQGLGLVFGMALVACVALLIWKCVKAATKRMDNAVAPAIAGCVGCLVAVHALVDFGLQIQAVTLTFAALLGAGLAQSFSSRRVLQD
jgi:O-antigen ligase